MEILFLIISFGASVAGAICGIGGGVIIKPTMDIFALASVSAVSFLSGCSVLAMSLYSVGRGLISGSSQVELRTVTPLAIGAALGGVAGNQLLGLIKSSVPEPGRVGAVQAAVLGGIALGTFLYLVFQKKIRTRHLTSKLLCLLTGVLLGIFSSFLGIGGGPINLVVLYFFFSMDTKTAAGNSLYVILFSQTANLLTALITGSVPEFAWMALVMMIAGGISGGIAGRALAKKMSNQTTNLLLKIMMLVIIGFCCYNVYQYA